MSKKLTSPASSGNAGAHFEACVQASFVTLMLSGGYVPCLPCWPIVEIKLQGRIRGFQTDDFIVFVENPSTHERRKLLGQVKLSVEVTKNNRVFSECIQAAWEDFNNPKIFTRGKDAIALMTGPLSAIDERNVQFILDHARHTKDVDEFLLHVRQANFSPSKCEEKFAAIKYQLKKANGGNEVTKDDLYDFLKHFHLLDYDLKNEHGVVLSLLHSHMSQFQHDSPQELWSCIVYIVQNWNKDAGSITRHNLPEDLLNALTQKQIVVIPKEFESVQAEPITDWTLHEDASYLVLAVLLGSWNEKNQNDIDAVTKFLGISYEEWLKKVREILLYPDSPLSLCDGIWKVKNRAELCRLLGARILDQNIEAFGNLAESILKTPDPIYKLPINRRFTANVHGCVPEFSSHLRKGIAEGLAIMGSMPEACCNCSTGKVSGTCSAVLYRMLNNADWTLWGSLNILLPYLAESAPDEFLEEVEKAFRLSPCPFEELFAQENKDSYGNNYMCGLLWALECLAWDEKHLVRVSAILGELASLDPGGQRSNRPDNSLVTIFLPWYPQTMASIQKRKVAVKTLLREWPAVAWKLIIRLLPGQMLFSSGSHKPTWRKIIPDNWENKVRKQDYLTQVSYYAELAVDIARDNADRLAELIDYFDNLPNPAFDQFIELLESESILALPEEKRLLIWEQLTKFINNLQRYQNKKQKRTMDLRDRLEQIIRKLSPTNPFYLYKPLFSNRDFELYVVNGDRREQSKKLEKRREKGLVEIIQQYGVDGILKFAKSVSHPDLVGYCLRLIANDEFEQAVFPHLLNTTDSKLKDMLSSFIFWRHIAKGWDWSDHIIQPEWTREQIALFLLCLPFYKGTWDRVSERLNGEQDKYWTNVNVAPYYEDDNLSFAIEKLIDYGRPHDAIKCLFSLLQEKKPIDTNQCINALLTGFSSCEQENVIDHYGITQLITYP